MELELTTANFNEEMSKAEVMLVDFWASWCGPCRMQAPILEAFAAAHPEVTVAKVNVDDNPALAEQYRIMSIPSLLVFKNGALVKTAVGLHDATRLAELVK